MSSANENAASSTPVSSQVEPAVDAANATSAAAATSDDQALERKEVIQDKVFKTLMELYTESSKYVQWVERDIYLCNKYNELPDKHDIWYLRDMIKDLDANIQKICELAKTLDSKLELVKAPKPAYSDSEDESSDESENESGDKPSESESE